MARMTVKEMLALKGKRQFTEVYVRNTREAAACDAAGIDMIMVGEQSDLAMRHAAPNAFMSIGLHIGEYFTASEWLRAAYKALHYALSILYGLCI